MSKLYEVIVQHEDSTGKIFYSRLEHKGRSTWKTKRIAQKHAREFKAVHLRDSWVQEV